MSKYDALWAYIQKDGRPSFKLTFMQILLFEVQKGAGQLWVPGGENLDEGASGDFPEAVGQIYSQNNRY